MSSTADAASASASGGLNYIEHQVSKMDTLAGVAIKYGVEVADIKRMNGLATDLQMFALKSLQIPLPGRHPPSTSLPNGSVSLRERCTERTPPRLGHSKVIESLQTPRLKSPQRKVSSAMSTLQKYYGLNASRQKSAAEGTEMAVYKSERSHFSENGGLMKASPFSDPPPLPHHHRHANFVDAILTSNGSATEDLFGEREGEKSSENFIRRRQKIEADSGAGTPEKLLREESGSGSKVSAITGKGLALRPKSASRATLVIDTDTARHINSTLNDSGDSITVDGLSGFRKSSSTPSLQERDGGNASSVWPTSKWNLKPDLQALSTAAIARPLFDGLPKPITGLWNKAARD